ncbi:MAG: IS5 family transposase [Blautia sp.]|nr:IS5 family transposase [Blautia sp.]
MQQNFTDIEYSCRKKETRRDKFLNKMDKMVPWADWIAMIEPFYPSGRRGRPTRGIEIILRMYMLQNWFNLADEALEDAVYDSYSFRSFLHLDFFDEQVPDATTLLKFRRFLEKNKIGEKIFADVKERLEKAGLMMHGGTIVDAGSGYIHTITSTGANVHDVNEAHKLIRKDDDVMYGDSGYSGMRKREEVKKDPHLSKVEYRTNIRPSSLKTKDSYQGINWDKNIENRKSSTRCKVEHPFLIVKRLFGYSKVRYRGLAKNFNRFNVLFACANLVMCERAGRISEFQGVSVSI